MNDLITNFVFFFAVIDPIGTVPVFIAVTKGFDVKEKKLIAFKSVMYACLVLLFFIIAGEPILNAISIPLSAFQIAGGIVLFFFTLSMIFGDSKGNDTDSDIPVGYSINSQPRSYAGSSVTHREFTI